MHLPRSVCVPGYRTTIAVCVPGYRTTIAVCPATPLVLASMPAIVMRAEPH